MANEKIMLRTTTSPIFFFSIFFATLALSSSKGQADSFTGVMANCDQDLVLSVASGCFGQPLLMVPPAIIVGQGFSENLSTDRNFDVVPLHVYADYSAQIILAKPPMENPPFIPEWNIDDYECLRGEETPDSDALTAVSSSIENFLLISAINGDSLQPAVSQQSLQVAVPYQLPPFWHDERCYNPYGYEIVERPFYRYPAMQGATPELTDTAFWGRNNNLIVNFVENQNDQTPDDPPVTSPAIEAHLLELLDDNLGFLMLPGEDRVLEVSPNSGLLASPSEFFGRVYGLQRICNAAEANTMSFSGCSGAFVQLNDSSFFVTAKHCADDFPAEVDEWFVVMNYTQNITLEELDLEYVHEFDDFIVLDGDSTTYHPHHDLAIIPVKSVFDPPVGLRIWTDRSSLATDNNLLMFGHPFGLSRLISQARIATVGNSGAVGTVSNYPRSSGSPLINGNGEVVGVFTSQTTTMPMYASGSDADGQCLARRLVEADEAGEAMFVFATELSE